MIAKGQEGTFWGSRYVQYVSGGYGGACLWKSPSSCAPEVSTPHSMYMSINNHICINVCVCVCVRSCGCEVKHSAGSNAMSSKRKR